MSDTLINIPRIYTGVAEWMSCMVFILIMKKRFPVWGTIAAASGAYYVMIEFLMRTTNVPLYLWIPCMVMAGLMMSAFIYLCCDVGWIDALYFGMIAFIMSEFTASFEWQITSFLSITRIPTFFEAKMLVFIFYNGTSFLLYKLMRPYVPADGAMHISGREFISVLMIVAAIFTMSNFSFLSIETPFTSNDYFQIGNIRTLVDAGGVAILYALLVHGKEANVRRELETVQNVLQNQYVQYKQSRESIDLINYKYHDLKHQIAYLRSEEDPEKRAEFLNRMEEEIRQYDAQNKTGNKVLDTILTAKSLYCAKHDIGITCVADGTLLDFMDVMDICSIFGNALDNAIECERKIEDKEKRLIHVTVSRQKNFLLLRFENYCEEIPEYKGEYPVSTKKEKEFHGYGLKSIRYTIDKYNGALNISTEDNWFMLKILIPVSQS